MRVNPFIAFSAEASVSSASVEPNPRCNCARNLALIINAVCHGIGAPKIMRRVRSLPSPLGPGLVASFRCRDPDDVSSWDPSDVSAESLYDCE